MNELFWGLGIGALIGFCAGFCAAACAMAGLPEYLLEVFFKSPKGK